MPFPAGPPLPTPTFDGAVEWVTRHLAGLIGPSPVSRHPQIRGGQSSAQSALQSLDIRGYASRRNHVLPVQRQGATRLSPWIRHGLLQLRQVWDHVADAPARDRRKFRDELLWQEYARHVYARVGRGMAQPLRAQPPHIDPEGADHAWDRDMACMDLTVGWLEEGWLPNQTRMWLASDWTVRHRARWQDGEDLFFRHLLDGSRAANRLGWQWTVGTGTNKRYGFSQWQVKKRAPGLCETCPLVDDCPIAGWPDGSDDGEWLAVPQPGVRGGPDNSGPSTTVAGDGEPSQVWLTAESLGDADPALAAWPDLPAVFVFDRALLARLKLASPRLVFLVETLADLATRRPLKVFLGDPVTVLDGVPLAVTHAPVPGFTSRARQLTVKSMHPYPWLVRPAGTTVQSFTAWRRAIGEPPSSVGHGPSQGRLPL